MRQVAAYLLIKVTIDIPLTMRLMDDNSSGPAMGVSAQQLADMLPTGVAMLDHNDKAVFTNRRFRDLMTRQNPRSFECWSRSIHPDDYDRLEKAYHEASRTRQPLRIEYRTREEHCPWRLLMLAPMSAEESTQLGLHDGGSLCTIVDISQEKTAELSHKRMADDARQRKIQQERFIDMISHEVRNPLSAIMHCTEDILEAIQTDRRGDDDRESESDKQKAKTRSRSIIAQATETISLCIRHQKKIVDDVLSFSKLDAGMLTLTPRPVEPHRRLATSLMMFRPELRQEKIEFEYKLDPSYQDCDVGWVMADMDRMSQVLINLVTNAIKFTANSGGEMKIRVSLGASTVRPPSYPPNVVFFDSDEAALRLDRTGQPEWGDGPAAFIMVAVRDTGIGIDSESQKRLFERFNQGTPRTQSNYGGSGLGLNVSRRLCHLHGGEIGVSSKEGEGSTFGFFFTARRTDSDGRTSKGKATEAEIDEICRDVQSLGDEVTGGEARMSSPAIPEEPEVARVEEMSPQGKEKKTSEHSAKLADEAGTPASKHSQSEPEPEPSHEQPKDPAERRGSHILLVEDNIINRRIVSRKLHKLGFRVTEASDGREALNALHRDKFDCVLMDQAMPVMDGTSATKAFRDLEKRDALEPIPVIGVTANVRAEQLEEMLVSGMDDVIQKPYKMDELTQKIQHLMEKRRNPR